MQNSNNATNYSSDVRNQLLFANNRNRVRWVVLCLSQDGACTDFFENFRENSLKGDLWNDITLNPPLFSLANTFNGIKWKMIDIAKKMTIYFFQNVWKCTVFAFAFQVFKKCSYDPKIFSQKILIWVTKNGRILCWFQIRWCLIKLMPLEKPKAKKLCDFWVFSFLRIFCVFI